MTMLAEREPLAGVQDVRDILSRAGARTDTRFEELPPPAGP